MPGQESISIGWKDLNSFTKGDVCIIKRIHERLEDNPETMKFLEDNLVLPGNCISVQEVLPFDKTIQININEKSVTIGFEIAEKIFAKEI